MIFSKFFRYVLAFAPLIACMSAYAGDNGMRLPPIDSIGLVKDYYKKTPLFLDQHIQYIERQSKGVVEKNFGKLTQREIFTLFPKKYLYDAPNGKLRFFNLDKSEPDTISSYLKNTSTENYGYVLGKIEIKNSSWKILVIIEGENYYPRRIMLYPINGNGDVLSGLEVSNWAADDLENLTVTSNIKNSGILTITTTITQTIYKDMPPKQQKRDVIENREKKVIRWEFDSNEGFVVRDKK